MIRFLKLLTRSLILLVVALFSALAAMRIAIHGREVRVPNVKGLTTLQAQETANSSGLIVSVEDKFYSGEVPAGRVISQFPVSGSRVRRGWRIRVAESLGPQRATIPDLSGQTEHAATLNLRQRGLELATLAAVSVANATPDQIVAQVPPPNAKDAVSPKVSVLLAQTPPKPEYVMPNFVGHVLAEAKEKIAKAGLQPAKVSAASGNTPQLQQEVGATSAMTTAPPETSNSNVPPIPPSQVPLSGRIVSQSPQPGSRVNLDSQIKLVVAR
ncbi:MAG TPA: PASTA domain-containing protein [Terriglobales bacterium]|nr:PASTA domain-containing protein [Terriglobales bacterium]